MCDECYAFLFKNEEIDVEQQKYGTEENKVKKNGGGGE